MLQMPLCYTMLTVFLELLWSLTSLVCLDSHQPYSWDTWPHDEERAKCGYVGLTNLGATCYMATCMQHLYMIPEARKSVIEAMVCTDIILCRSPICREIL